MKTFKELTAGKELMLGPLFKGIDKIACKDDLRPVFMGAYVTEGKIVCTDGHHLIEIDLSFFGIDDQGKKDLENKFIETDILVELSKIKNNQYFFIDDVGFHLVRPGTNKISRSYPVHDIADTGDYPKYKSVIPTEFKEIAEFSINGQLLLNIQNIYKHVYGSPLAFGLKINTCGNNKPLLITNEEKTFLGLLMPIANS